MLGLIIFAVALLRLWIILCFGPVKKYWYGGPAADAAAYMLLIQFYRKNTRGNPDPRCLITNKEIYAPNLYEKTVGKIFSDKKIKQYSWLPNFVIFLLALLIIYFISNNYLSDNGKIILVFILFAIKSDNLFFDYNRIHYLSLQPRYLGVIVCSAFWALYSLAAINLTISILMVGLAVLIWNVSKFSVQALVLPSLLIALIFQDYLPISITAVSFMLNYLFFGDLFLNGINLHFKYLIWQIRRKFSEPRNKAGLKKLILKMLAPQVRGIFSYLDFIFIILVMYFLVTTHESKTERVEYLYLSVLVLFILTSFKKLSFIGESWRYISFCTYITSPIVIASFYDHDLIGATQIIVILCLFYISSWLNKGEYIKNNNSKLSELLEENKEKLLKSNWISIPYFSALPIITNGFGKRCLYFQTGNWTNEILNNYFTVYPFLKYTNELIHSHDITHLLLEKEYIGGCPDDSLPNYETLELLAENEYFSIFKIKK